jgi:hypothetical protein
MIKVGCQCDKARYEAGRVQGEDVVKTYVSSDISDRLFCDTRHLAR